MNKYKIVSLMLALLFVMTACSGSPAAPSQSAGSSAPADSSPASSAPAPSAPAAEPQAEGGTLIIAASDDWSSFDPYFQISLSNRIYNPMLFETLIKVGNGVYEPGLATEWSFNSDFTQVTLKLREGVKFQDGSDFTAEDVVWNIERAKDTDAGYHITEFFEDCASVEATDTHTVVLTWAQTSFIIEDALSRLYMISPENADKVATEPVGTGPFALKVWKPGDHAEFVRNENYWAEGKPYLDTVDIKIITDGQSRAINLMAGDVHIIDNVNSQDVSLLVQNGNISILENIPPEYKNFSVNMARKPFDSQLVRQAIAHSVDREMVRDMAYDGQGDIRYLPIVASSKFYPKDLENYFPYDLEKAKSLLTEAGYGDGFEFTLTVNMGIDGCLKQAEVLQASLSQIGVNVILEPLESASFFPRLTSNDFDMVSFGTGEPILDPSAYFAGASVARTTRNFFGVEADTFPEYTAMIQEAAAELDQEKRVSLYHDILKIMLEQSWTIPVTSTVTKVAASDGVVGFNVDNTAGEYHLESVKLA